MRRVVLLVVLVLYLPVASRAEDEFSFGVGAGLFDTAAWFENKGDFDALEAGIVLRWPTHGLWGIGPMAGLSVTDDSAFWGYFGGRRPFGLGGCVTVSPSFSVTYYEQGDGKDLGSELEFRSGLEVACRRANGSSLGVEFYHLSNASISNVNPGSNSLWVIYTVPFGG